mmetsp:Transcript_50836/g.111296  ORF Transcript_50836/g.111296 Transcript_50836/m.111296 type:complete len:236 (+) Transcript_50836:263-970(+)
MPLHPLSPADPRRGSSHARRGLLGAALEGHNLDVLVDRQSPNILGSAHRGQRVIRPGGLVTVRDTDLLAKEEGSVALQVVQPPLEVFALDLQVLRRVGVGLGHSLLPGGSKNNLPVVSPGLVGDRPVGLGEIIDQGLNASSDVPTQLLIQGDQPARRRGSVLGLGYDVHSDHLRIRCLVGDHRNLGWSSEHVNCASTVGELLGRCHKSVPRPNQNIRRKTGEKPKAQCCNSLHAS